MGDTNSQKMEMITIFGKIANYVSDDEKAELRTCVLSQVPVEYGHDIKTTQMLYDGNYMFSASYCRPKAA